MNANGSHFDFPVLMRAIPSPTLKCTYKIIMEFDKTEPSSGFVKLFRTNNYS